MKTLVELTFKELPNNHNEYHFRGINNNDSVNMTNLHNVLVSESLVVSKWDSKEEVHYLKEGFKFYEEDWYTGKLVFRKEEHYCFTNETKEVLDKLYSEKIKKLERALQKSEERYKDTNNKLCKLEDKMQAFSTTVSTASFLKRLKYLFTGELL